MGAGLELYAKRKDGTEFPVDVALGPMKLDGTTLILCAIRDVSERRLAEQQMRQLAMAVEQTADCVIITDREGVIQYVNAAFEKETGYTREEALGKTPRILKSGEHDPRFFEVLWKTILSGNVFRSVFINRKKTGELFYEQKTITPLVDTKGNITHFISTAKNITEQMQAEKALRESEERYRDLFESTSDLIQAVAPDGRLLYANRAWCEALGYTEEKLIGLNIDRVVHPEALTQCFETLQRAMSGEKIDRIETHFVTKDGKTIIVEGSVACRFDASQPIAVTCFLRDITKRREAEETLRASEVKYRSLFESVLEGIYQSTADGRLLTANPAFVRMLGYESEEELKRVDIGRDLYVNPAKRTALTQRLEKDGILKNLEVSLNRKDGTHITVLENVHVVRDEQGAVLYYEGTLADITERKKAEEALQQSEEQFRLIAENVGDLIAILDLDGKRLYNNPSYRNVLGDPEQLRGTDSFQEIHAEDRENIRNIFFETVRTGIGQRAEFRFVTKEGGILHIESQGSVIRDEEGKISKVVAVSRDITEKKSREAQLLQTQRLQSLGTLAGGIAHDFNNILAIIMGHTSLMQQMGYNPERFSQWIETILIAGRRGTGLVRQLLTFARKTEPKVELVFLNDIVNEILELTRETMPKTIVVESNTGKDLPLIQADANQLYQVMLNLCVNARDAMPNGGRLTITTLRQPGEMIRTRFPNAIAHEYIALSFADTGVGMDDATRKRIFEPFFTTKERGKGTGLGLSMVYGIMESHKGFVDVESEVGQGTTFHLFFPVMQQPMKLEQSKEPTPEEIPGGSETILLVEDEEMLNELVKTILETRGYKVIAARDGEEAIEKYTLHQQEIGLVLCDLGLPKVSGDEVLARLRALNPTVRFILASGHIEPEMKSQLLRDGAKAVIQKPYHPNEILRTIRSILDQK